MKYKLSAAVTVSTYCEVEADSPEEAITKSRDLPAQLSFNGSGNTAEDAWLVEEADGEPQGITCEEAE